MAAGAILLQLIIGVFVQLQFERLNSAMSQLTSLQGVTDTLETEHNELYLNYDYFYVNNPQITFSSTSAYFCFADFNVEAGETLDFSAMASSKGASQLMMKLFKDGAQIAKSH